MHVHVLGLVVAGSAVIDRGMWGFVLRRQYVTVQSPRRWLRWPIPRVTFVVNGTFGRLRLLTSAVDGYPIVLQDTGYQEPEGLAR